eukprot:m.319432 g.319432  ORF g.319432 m.319432 type:complete len:205 (+) comp23153_c0_seq1:67-681(+)
MPAGKNQVPNAHFHKDWQVWVRTHFDQPGKKKSRRVARAKKLQQIAPRPAAGFVRPIVRCPTFKYNTKNRLGKGFTLEELKAAGVGRKKALTIGISVDHRRKNKSSESLQQNTQRLKQYLANLVVLPKDRKASKEEIKMVPQLLGDVLPLAKADKRVRARKITEEEKKANVYQHMRMQRSAAKFVGVRQKRADDKAAEEAMKKK